MSELFNVGGGDFKRGAYYFDEQGLSLECLVNGWEHIGFENIQQWDHVESTFEVRGGLLTSILGAVTYGLPGALVGAFAGIKTIPQEYSLMIDFVDGRWVRGTVDTKAFNKFVRWRGQALDSTIKQILRSRV